MICRDLSLGLVTKVRAEKGVGQKWSSGVTFHAPGNVGRCEGMNPHTPKWAPIWGVEVLMDSQIFRKWLQGSKFIGSNSSLYDWKSLECRCLKWARMTHLDTQNTSYGQKKGRESNWQFDFQPLKVGNCFDFLVCMWCATYRWKALNEGYSFALVFISIGGLHTKLWASKVMRVLILGISGLPFWNPETKWHLGAGPMARHREYYKGDGGAFPQI
jgi:hypothetical protein